MCMKYEKKYGECFDMMLGEGPPELSILPILKSDFDIDIKDRSEFGRRLFACFEKMHEDGVIAPRPQVVYRAKPDTWFDEGTLVRLIDDCRPQANLGIFCGLRQGKLDEEYCPFSEFEEVPEGEL